MTSFTGSRHGSIKKNGTIKKKSHVVIEQYALLEQVKAVCCLMGEKLLRSTNRLRSGIIYAHSLWSNYILLTTDSIYQSINSNESFGYQDVLIQNIIE